MAARPMKEVAAQIAAAPAGDHRNLGILRATLGRKSEAIQHLRAALEIVPNEPNAREVLEALERESPERLQ